MNTIEHLQDATGLSMRSVRRYLTKLKIRPIRVEGTLLVYPDDTVQLIQDAQLEGADRRREAVQAATARRSGLSIISVREARRRAAKQKGDE